METMEGTGALPTGLWKPWKARELSRQGYGNHGRYGSSPDRAMETMEGTGALPIRLWKPWKVSESSG